jgi:hypothetical protein
MASEATPLENDLVAFVEGHPETFSKQDVVNLRRKIIASFALMEGIHDESKPGVGNLANIILEKMSEKIKDKPINTSQDVTFTLTQFDLCSDFLKRFLTPLCNTVPRLRTPSGFSSGYPEPRQVCMEMRRYLDGNSGHIWLLVNRNIDEYLVRVLKLWADILVHYGIIKTEAITDARTAGYDVKYNQFWEKVYSSPEGIKSDLEDSVLLEYLTLVHVATPAQMLAERVTRVTYLVFSVISQFVPFNMVNGTGVSPPDAILPTGKHNSELNMMRLICNVVEKPYPRTPGKLSEIEPGFVESPIKAYLSCDTLDKCVQTLKHFPTMEEFLQAQMVEKMGAAALAPPSPSAPLLSELGGGKKTRRKENKKRKYFKKSHRRFYRY